MNYRLILTKIFNPSKIVVDNRKSVRELLKKLDTEKRKQARALLLKRVHRRNVFNQSEYISINTVLNSKFVSLEEALLSCLFFDELTPQDFELHKYISENQL